MSRRTPLAGRLLAPEAGWTVDTDVVIVGAGYTGLWTAYYLAAADPALRVIVLPLSVSWVPFAIVGTSRRRSCRDAIPAEIVMNTLPVAGISLAAIETV